MSIPISKIDVQSERSEIETNQNQHPLVGLVQENCRCEEIKLQIGEDGIKRVIATEKITVREAVNIERICREFSNQDITIKIRNGKKISIERSRIINT